jgi:two-component system chemotaxis sensor kinase CheA
LPEDETLVGIKGWVDQCMSLMKTFFFRLSQLRLMTVDDFMGLFTHAIHQLARTSEKQVRLTVSGGEIHADITLLERLREPLIHLFRNCIAHGIEPPDERTRSGKQATGEIQVTANAHRERLVLEISDDGRGIDPDPIRLFLKEKRRMSEDRIAKMTEEEIFRTILHPDYSSMTETTDIAGRGVGMSVVSQAIEHIGGSLNIHSKKNEGTRFVITMPLSLSIIYAITFKIGSFTLSIPTSEVASIRGVADITREEMERTIDLKGYLEPGGKLSTSFYHFIELKSDRTDGNGDGASPFTGLPVDAIVGNNPLMVMPIGELLSKAGIFSGVGIMENGDVSMVLDVGWLKKHV